MTKLQTHDFEQQLTGMRSALLAQIAEQRGGTISRVEVAADHFGHPEEAGAQLASERELEFALGERELAELAAIDAALARLAAGTFGECTDCGKHIPRHACMPAPKRCAASTARKKSTSTPSERPANSTQFRKKLYDYLSRRRLAGP